MVLEATAVYPIQICKVRERSDGHEEGKREESMMGRGKPDEEKHWIHDCRHRLVLTESHASTPREATGPNPAHHLPPRPDLVAFPHEACGLSCD